MAHTKSGSKRVPLRLFAVVECSSPSMKLAELGVEQIDCLLSYNIRLVWDRDGERRTIPYRILKQAYKAYQDGMKMVNADRLGTALEAAHLIRWEQTEPH